MNAAFHLGKSPTRKPNSTGKLFFGITLQCCCSLGSSLSMFGCFKFGAFVQDKSFLLSHSKQSSTHDEFSFIIQLPLN